MLRCSMKSIVCFSFVFLFMVILECDGHWGSKKSKVAPNVVPESRQPRRYSHYRYGSYRSTSCLERGCPHGQACRRKIRVTKSPVSRCLPDIRGAIRSCLDIFETGFNTRDFQLVKNLFTVNALTLPAGLPIIRGRAAWPEFLANLIADLNWDRLTWTLDTLAVGTDDFVSSALFFEITSSVNGPTTVGKASLLWRRMRNEYEIDMFTYNFNT